MCKAENGDPDHASIKLLTFLCSQRIQRIKFLNSWKSSHHLGTYGSAGHKSYSETSGLLCTEISAPRKMKNRGNHGAHFNLARCKSFLLVSKKFNALGLQYLCNSASFLWHPAGSSDSCSGLIGLTCKTCLLT